MPETLLLEARGLKKHFPIHSGFLRGKTIGHVKAVDDVSFTLADQPRYGVCRIHEPLHWRYVPGSPGRSRHGRSSHHAPTAPYTATLVAAATSLGRTPPWQLPLIGEGPSPLDTPPGCAFHPRCPYAMPVFRQDRPMLSEVEPQRWAACHLYPDHIQTIDKSGNE
jgi:oligopeptide/dipeptide ABC transporter ATP-binding protein